MTTTPESSSDEAAQAAPLGVLTEPAPNAGGSPPASKPSGVRRVIEWFWLGGAMRALAAEKSALPPRGLELLRRARLSAELGARALEPSEAFLNGTGDALACELYRQALYWALAAHEALGRTRDGTPSGVAAAPGHDALPVSWERVDPAVLDAAGPEARQRIERDVVNRTFADFAELAPEEQGRLARELQAFVSALIGALDLAESRRDRLWLLRIARVGGLAALLVLAVIAVKKLGDLSERRGDLALNATWRTSSVYPEGGCPSPQQICANSPNFFFHTHEDQTPWVEFDLGAPKRFSTVVVKNRLDCCYDRAMPLVLEVSGDGKAWRQIAKREDEFTTWRAEFAPTEARYVRLSVPKRTNLHLAQVRILP